jgi:Kef-type K+ transport system membrane component KefB
MELSLPFRLAFRAYIFPVTAIEFNVHLLLIAIPLFLALLAVSIVTKIAAGCISAKIVGFSRELNLAICLLLNVRGMVELIIGSASPGCYRHDFFQ